MHLFAYRVVSKYVCTTIQEKIKIDNCTSCIVIAWRQTFMKRFAYLSQYNVTYYYQIIITSSPAIKNHLTHISAHFVPLFENNRTILTKQKNITIN